MLRPIAALALALAALAMPAAASAQSDDERAHAHFLAGRSYFDQRRYGDAAEQFREAYRLSHRSVLLINVSTSLERAGRLEEAAQALEEFLQVEPESPDRGTLEERIRQLRLQVAEATTPVEPAPVEPAAPAEASSEGAGGLNELSILGIAVASAGAAVGIAAIATGVVAADIHGSLESRCGPGGTSCPDGFQSDVDTGNALSITNTVLTPVSIAAIGAGVVLLVLGLEQGPSSESESARVTGGPGDIGIGVAISF